jgi:CRISPR/Cas system endoribonuclease Cas6 (RAMP superfamily)
MKARDKWSRVTVTLARYAEYSNIGGNRTGGFGVVKVVENKQNLRKL